MRNQIDVNIYLVKTNLPDKTFSSVRAIQTKQLLSQQ